MKRTLAAIDVGSNALRMRISEWRDGELREVESLRASLRLGHDAFERGHFRSDTLDRAAETLRDFRRAMDRAGVDDYRAVATSATGEAKNGLALVSRASQRAGIDLEVIGGAEEARLVRIGVEQELSLRARSVLVDVGGGSTEVMHVQGGRNVYSRSLPIGAVRLMTVHRAHRDMKDAIDLAAASVARRIDRSPRFIATGGSARALARICGKTIELDELREVVRRMRRMTPLERMREYGLRADRADTIVPAGVVFVRLALALGARTLLAPRAGLRDGILFELGSALRRRAA